MLWFLPALIAVFFLLLRILYRMAFYSPNRTQNNIFNFPNDPQYTPYRDLSFQLIRTLKDRPCEVVSIRSHDGLVLQGRYYHCRDGAPLDICIHGYRSTAIRDMCGIIRLLDDLKHNVLLVDQRAHSNSQGHAISFGIRERWDCLSWVNYARERFGEDVRILLCGVSMGAATVLMASDLDFGGCVRGILADSPYSSPEKIIRKVCRDMHLPDRPLWPLIALSARLWGGFKLTELTAAEAAGRSDLPILIMHGEDDRFVPQEMSAEIAQARPDIQRHTFPGAAHAFSNIVDTPRYERIAKDFIAQCLKD